MAATALRKPVIPKDDSDDDKELQIELKGLVDRITGDESKLVSVSLDMLKYLIRTSTSSMTSVPKPLKYLAPYYGPLRDKCDSMKDSPLKKNLSDIVSVLSMGAIDGAVKRDYDCLKYCLQGTMENIGDWGHEYIRQLETEIVKQWVMCENNYKTLSPLVKEIMRFNCTHHDAIQGCDLLMEINQMYMLFDYVTKENYKPICLYLASCAKYVDELESKKILKLISQFYYLFGEHCRCLIVAIQIKDSVLIEKLFNTCTDKITLYQMAFICARHLYPIEFSLDDDDTRSILENSHLSHYFLSFVRELDIMEPKSPEDVYKTWLEPVTLRQSVLGEKLDSARQNLASSFVNGFVNAAFGTDKLLTTDDGNKWIYRNKDVGMLSATAALGLLYLWDVDGGLTPIDKYLYTSDDNIKAGALLALGIVNCRIRNDCDPALALLGDYVGSGSEELQVGAVLGIGLAYAGSGRSDVLNLLLPVIQTSKSVKTLGVTSLACGLVSLGMNNNELSDIIITKMLESNGLDVLKSPFMLLAGLGVALSYFGTKDAIEVPTIVAEVFEEPFRTIFQTMLQMCAYAGSGDVLIIQELLRLVEEKVEVPEIQTKDKKKNDWDYYMGKAVAVLAVAAISKGEEIGSEMIQRIFGQISRYGEPSVRRAVPLAIALTSVSDPQPTIINVLTKYSHDVDDDVACNAIFGLGYVGAGTNNARLAVTLRQLALYHAKNPFQLFMVRIAQGLVHMGKGTMTLNPLHTDRQLLDPVAMAGILIPLVCLLKPHSLILGRCHYLLYCLAAAMQPRWLLTLDDNLNSVSVTVRVGQAVDTVGKAGEPKTIAGIHTHTTPVLLCANERAELANGEFESAAPALDGICVLKKLE
ncbi:26S proteasome non-ATPase regulatory subunit 2-like [Tribolium madens]|uniref:26S proteasome non-ATPase regulatory subunit 2-like n=1 Tax=Tribolium madens TaxID=41895 RepID=UPI001CF75155|nr:26S proteasome non-ATPase regulatory subunit 2-like [Tribolium madens]